MQPSNTPDLTLRQLQTVVALAEYGSFIAAAALMKTSQPAVTRTVKHLEEALGIKLFDRSTRSVQITAAGKEFAAVAARMLNDLKITVGSMRELADQRRGQIIVSSIMSVANGKLPRMVAAYRLNYPGIELYVRDGVHGTVIEDVRSGAADFGITYLDELPDPFVSVRARQGGVHRRAAAQSSPRREEQSLALVDLRGLPLVSLPGDSRTRRVDRQRGGVREAGLEARRYRLAVRDHARLRARRHRHCDRAKKRRCGSARQGIESGAASWQAAGARPRNCCLEGARTHLRPRRADVIDPAVMEQDRD